MGDTTRRTAGESAPTLHDVAAVAGVSFSTVSNVIRNSPLVREATRQRVLDAISSVGYRPNLAARNLRSGRSGVIGLAVPELNQSYFAQLADDVIRAAEARGYVVLVEQTGGRRERERELLRDPRLALTDGTLISPLGLTGQDVSDIALGRPVVVLGQPLLGEADHLTMQHEAAAHAATNHLIELGRKRIVLLGAHPAEQGSTASLRRDGYRSALEAAGLPMLDELVVPIEVWDRHYGAHAMRELLGSGTAFDGVFAMNDDLALGAMRAMHESGVRIPDDIAVIGFDDIDEGRYSFPSLSTVDPGRRQIAELGVSMLLERVMGTTDAIEPRMVAPEFHVIVRESTGA